MVSGYAAVMALWLVAIFILLSATALTWATSGPLRNASNVNVLRTFAAVQYVAAAILLIVRAVGRA